MTRHIYSLLRMALDGTTSILPLRPAVVQRAVAVVVAQARADGIAVDEVLRALKDAWAEVQESNRIEELARAELLDGLLKASLTAYFEVGPVNDAATGEDVIGRADIGVVTS